MHEYTGAQKVTLTRAALVNHIMVSVDPSPYCAVLATVVYDAVRYCSEVLVLGTGIPSSDRTGISASFFFFC